MCVFKDGMHAEDSDKMLAGAHFNDALSPSFCWDHQLIRKGWFTAGAGKRLSNTLEFEWVLVG